MKGSIPWRLQEALPGLALRLCYTQRHIRDLANPSHPPYPLTLMCTLRRQPLRTFTFKLAFRWVNCTSVNNIPMTIDNWLNRISKCYPRNTRFVSGLMLICSQMLFVDSLTIPIVTDSILSRTMHSITHRRVQTSMVIQCLWWTLSQRYCLMRYMTSIKVPSPRHSCSSYQVERTLNGIGCGIGLTSAILSHGIDHLYAPFRNDVQCRPIAACC